MPQDDDMLHFKETDCILKGGTYPMVGTVMLAGRHQVRNVTNNKQLTRSAAGEKSRINPGIAAANHQGLRFLLTFQSSKE
jgi:hypothetical protein